MEEEDKIASLDDFDTESIIFNGWRLDRLFTGEIENTIPTYEKAMLHAEDLVNKCKVGVRTVTHNNVVYWEVYKKD